MILYSGNPTSELESAQGGPIDDPAPIVRKRRGPSLRLPLKVFTDLSRGPARLPFDPLTPGGYRAKLSNDPQGKVHPI